MSLFNFDTNNSNSSNNLNDSSKPIQSFVSIATLNSGRSFTAGDTLLWQFPESLSESLFSFSSPSPSSFSSSPSPSFSSSPSPSSDSDSSPRSSPLSSSPDSPSPPPITLDFAGFKRRKNPNRSSSRVVKCVTKNFRDDAGGFAVPKEKDDDNAHISKQSDIITTSSSSRTTSSKSNIEITAFKANKISRIRFSQTNVGREVWKYRDSMSIDGFDKNHPIEVVEMPDTYFTSLNNRRLLAAKLVAKKNPDFVLYAKVYKYDEQRYTGCFVKALNYQIENYASDCDSNLRSVLPDAIKKRTWGEAVVRRLQGQSEWMVEDNDGKLVFKTPYGFYGLPAVRK